MTIQKVTVFGTGNFGAGLAFHIAFNSMDVTVYDQDYGLLEEARTKFRELADTYKKNYGATKGQLEAALANIAYSMDITEAAGNAQLIIEAVVEDLDAKKSFYNELHKTAPQNAFFVSTSRGLDPDILAKASGRPGYFLVVHFKGNIGESPSLEIIASQSVREDAVKTVAEFSENLGMVVTLTPHLEKRK